MRLPLLILALFTLAGCSRPPAHSRATPPAATDSEAAALAPRFTFLPAHGDLVGVYRCNNYTGKIELVHISEPDTRTRILAAGDAREEVSLIPAISDRKP
jgi:uncharacterized lipoprotein YajG